jgi:hypothetical protein
VLFETLRDEEKVSLGKKNTYIHWFLLELPTAFLQAHLMYHRCDPSIHNVMKRQ